MKVVGAIVSNENTFVLCEGPELKAETRCAKFRVAGQTFETIGSTVKETFSGIPQLALLLRGKVDVPKGPMEILD